MTSERHDRPPEKLTGPRLVVRRYWPTDAPALHRAVTASIEHLRPWMPWISDEPLEVEDRRRLITEWDEAWEAGRVELVEVHHDVANLASGRVPQRLGFRWIEDRPEPVDAPAETGVRRIWRLTRDEWGPTHGTA